MRRLWPALWQSSQTKDLRPGFNIILRKNKLFSLSIRVVRQGYKEVSLIFLGKIWGKRSFLPRKLTIFWHSNGVVGRRKRKKMSTCFGPWVSISTAAGSWIMISARVGSSTVINTCGPLAPWSSSKTSTAPPALSTLYMTWFEDFTTILRSCWVVWSSTQSKDGSDCDSVLVTTTCHVHTRRN